MTVPPWTPPPANKTVMTGPQWSRPASLLILGVRPNSPVITTSVESSRPDSFRSSSSAETARSAGGRRFFFRVREIADVRIPG